MANDSFSDALHRLKEIHDKEVLGMQAKLTELTMEKCRDSQRIEELFSKNHLLREQHKVLNENIKVLENRLRAGLCDRCTVTQELAKKKQQEYESFHFQSLQQISSLTNEINLLKEENKSLLEELRRVQCLDSERSRSRSHTPEINATPEEQRPPVPSVNPKTERTSKERELGENNEDHHVSEEKCAAAVLRLSPVMKAFQIGSEARQADMKMSGVQKVLLKSQHSQQKISNQLHGTIAVMRPGVKSGHPATLSPPIHKRSSSNSSDINPRESHTEISESPSPLDPLRHVMPEEQFNFLRQHFAQKRLAQRSANEGAIRYLVSKNNEVVMERKRSEEEWEDKSAMADLQGAVLYLREQGYKNRVYPANQREKIQYLLSKQNQGLRSPTSPGDTPKCLVRESPEEKELSLIQVLSAHWRNSRRLNGQEQKQDWQEKETKCAEPEKRSHYEEEVTPDKPLDLSDTRRGQHVTHHDIKQEHKYLPECHMPRPASRNNSSPLTRATNHLPTSPAEGGIMKSKSELERLSVEAKQDVVMDHSRGTEAPTEARRPGKSHKRHRNSESDDQEGGHATDGDSSHQDMDGELDTSGSEEEIENSQNSPAEMSSRDSYASEENHGDRRWRKKMSPASKKSPKKKQKVAEDEEDTERERAA